MAALERTEFASADDATKGWSAGFRRACSFDEVVEGMKTNPRSRLSSITTVKEHAAGLRRVNRVRVLAVGRIDKHLGYTLCRRYNRSNR